MQAADEELQPNVRFCAQSLALLGMLDTAHNNLPYYAKLMSQWAAKPDGTPEHYIGVFLPLQVQV